MVPLTCEHRWSVGAAETVWHQLPKKGLICQSTFKAVALSLRSNLSIFAHQWWIVLLHQCVNLSVVHLSESAPRRCLKSGWRENLKKVGTTPSCPMWAWVAQAVRRSKGPKSHPKTSSFISTNVQWWDSRECALSIGRAMTGRVQLVNQ